VRELSQDPERVRQRRYHHENREAVNARRRRKYAEIRDTDPERHEREKQRKRDRYQAEKNLLEKVIDTLQKQYVESSHQQATMQRSTP
jgi:2,3-bisphosphoglycerate-independent phosphoglycerate mutase